MTTSTNVDRPWQVDWKRPEWQQQQQQQQCAACSNGSKDENRRIISSASAQVLPDEVPDGILSAIAWDSSHQNSTLFVTATVVVSSPWTAKQKRSSSSSTSAAVYLVVELFQQPSNQTENKLHLDSTHAPASALSKEEEEEEEDGKLPPIVKLYSRQLQWPESALLNQPLVLDYDDDENDKDDEHRDIERDDDDDNDNKAPNEQPHDEHDKSLSDTKKKSNHKMFHDFWMFFTGDFLFPQQQRQRQRHGRSAKGNRAASFIPTPCCLTAVALCRSPSSSLSTILPTKHVSSTTTGATTTATSDALDALTFLSFGLKPAATTLSATAATTSTTITNTIPTSLASPTSTNESSVTNTNQNEDDNTSDMPRSATTTTKPIPNAATTNTTTTDLLLTCLTASGKIHVYSLWKLLSSSSSLNHRTNKDHHTSTNGYGYDSSDSDDSDDFSRGWLELWLGPSIHEHVQQTIRPLSRPLATITLSTVSFRDVTKQQQQQHYDHDERTGSECVEVTVDDQDKQDVGTTRQNQREVVFEDDEEDEQVDMDDKDDLVMGRHDDGDDDGHDDDGSGVGGGGLPSLWDDTVWDSSIDPSTAIFRTWDNVPTHCVPAFEYLAIAGVGFRKRRRRRRHQREALLPHQRLGQHPKEKTTTSSTTSPTSPRRGKKSSQEQHQEAQQHSQHEKGKEDETDQPEWYQETQDASPARKKTDAANIRHHASSTDAPPQEKNHQHPSRRRQLHQQQSVMGGFVTLVSMYNFSEIRTLFLPFEPEHVSPIVWGDMTFLLVIPQRQKPGQYPYHPVAIRIDSQTNDGLVSCGQVPFLVSNNITTNEEPSTSLSTSSRRSISNESEQQRFCFIPRFKLLPVLLPRDESSSALELVGSSSFTFPPAMVVVREDSRIVAAATLAQRRRQEELFVTLHAWEAIDIIPKQLVDRYLRTFSDGVIPAIVTQHRSSHVARIPATSRHIEHNATATTRRPCWCSLGQGWCLVGIQDSVYFISWEGATSSSGAHVQLVGNVTRQNGNDGIFPGFILPSFTNSLSKRQALASTSRTATHVPDSPPMLGHQLQAVKSLRRTVFAERIDFDSEHSADVDYNASDEILVEALESISGLTYRRDSGVVSATAGGGVLAAAVSPHSTAAAAASRWGRRSSFGHKQRSAILLRHCSSWTQLDDTSHNRNNLENQVPVLCIRSGSTPSDCFVLSLRRIVVENGEATPFNHVLSWMSQQDNFFTAASVALALLRDAETLRHLWRATEYIEADDELSKLEGLLDGIVPLKDWNAAVGNDRTLCQLADMTVGCLVKGGFVMSTTLELFVSYDKHYDPARACLMLVAATVCTVSNDVDTMRSAMGRNYVRNDMHEDNILWPVRCLLQLGVSRGYLAKALILMNATIPDELRRRRPNSSLTSPAPSMTLCTSLVSLIVAAAPDAAELLLGLVDQHSRSRFWQSLDHETRLALSLVSISGKSPLLRQVEVRAWARKQLNECIKDEMSASGVDVYEIMPTEWLRQLCIACFRNAGCNLTYITNDSTLSCEPTDDEDDIEHYTHVLQTTRNALISARWSGGLDFDLVIPALLLVSRRGSQLHDDFQVSTQTILDTACYLAGRPGSEESMFAFDGATVMWLCAISGNVSAGANLIGGKDGLVLKCCDILMQEVGTTMDNAEGFLLNDEVNLQNVGSLIQFGSNRFSFNDGHRHLLRMLDEYVLKVRTFGDFQTDCNRGKVDPVFAARCCFRTWLCLTTPDTTNGSIWLAAWLRHRLGMADKGTISSRRLACAAILRALIWPPTNKTGLVDLSSSQVLLANALDVESRFLVQLAQACCGLVESLPHWVAEDASRNFDSAGQRSTSQLTLEV